MTTPNATQKRIIKALANAPAMAIKQLINQTSDQNEREQIKRIAAALGIDTETKPKYKTYYTGD